MNKITMAGILGLSVDERLELIEQIWATIGADPLTEEDHRELDRRLGDVEGDLGAGLRAWLPLPECRSETEYLPTGATPERAPPRPEKPPAPVPPPPG